MRLGLMSDVHGNRVALDAVVADGKRNGVEAWWVLGDLVAIGPDPVATLEGLVDLPNVRFVRGNTDRYVVSGERPPPHAVDVERDASLLPLFLAVEASFSWTRARVAADGWLDVLAALPSSQRADLADGTRLLGRVAYDHYAVLERLERSDHPQARYIAAFQRGEQVRHPASRNLGDDSGGLRVPLSRSRARLH